MTDQEQPPRPPEVEASFGDAKLEIPSMPLRVVVLSELTPRDLRTGASTERRELIPIDRQTFDEVMTGFGLRVFLDVPDRLSGGSEPLIVELALESLKSFRPEAIAAELPSTRDLLQVRAALVALRDGRSALSDVRAVLDSLETRSQVAAGILRALEGPAPATAEPASVAPATEPAAEGGLDALLEMVEAPAADSGPRPADLDRLEGLIRLLMRSERAAEPVQSRAVDAALVELDAALGTQIDEVLHHPELRRLEAAWRGLRFLTDRTDFEEEICIELIASGRDTLVETFDHLVELPESQGLSERPVSFVVLDQLLDRTPEDMELLQGLSHRAASLSAPILTGAGAAFLGLERAGDLGRRSGLRDVFAGPEYTKWQGLRESGPSRWLGLVFNRFLLRPGYGPGELETRGFAYTETPGADPDAHRAWGNPVWGLAALATGSFARLGWCTDLMGQRAGGMLENLAVRLYQRPGGETISFPLETVVPDAVERDLSANGVMALSAALNRDRASLRFAPTVHQPEHYQDPADKARARLQSTLPFQMFVGRSLNYAMLLERILVPGRGPEAISADFDRALRDLLATAGPVPQDAVQVAVLPNEEDASLQDLQLVLRWPGFQSLPGAGTIRLRWPLAA
jgi:type VI secretion system ImpC/EvpB family protein/type VI secretion system ImpB/VipA family protein